MDIIERLEAATSEPKLHKDAAFEIERLRAENEILRTAMLGANIAMASAPIWHSQHRVISEILIDLKKALAEIESTPEIGAVEQSCSPVLNRN